MVEVLACCQGPRWPTGRRVAVMTASGGLAELILDLGTAAGLELPPLTPQARVEMQRAIGVLSGDGNPLDAWGNGDYGANFPRAVALLGADPSYDVVTFCSDSFDDQPFGTPERLMAYARILTATSARARKTFYYAATRAGIFRQDVLAFLRARHPGDRRTRQGLGAIDRVAGWMRRRRLNAPPTPRTDPSLLARAYAATIHEHDAPTFLGGRAAHRGGAPRHQLVEARAARAALGIANRYSD
jgi:acyl-CoA synthetase (NDP forming)